MSGVWGYALPEDVNRRGHTLPVVVNRLNFVVVLRCIAAGNFLLVKRSAYLGASVVLEYQS